MKKIFIPVIICFILIVPTIFYLYNNNHLEPISGIVVNKEQKQHNIYSDKYDAIPDGKDGYKYVKRLKKRDTIYRLNVEFVDGGGQKATIIITVPKKVYDDVEIGDFYDSKNY
jgi:hypothetical protein